MEIPHGVCKAYLIDPTIASLGPRARGPLRSKGGYAIWSSCSGSLLHCSALHLAQNLSQTARHVVRSLLAPIVPLEVLEEADEEGVDRHGVDGEEGGGDEVAAKGDRHHRGEKVVKHWHPFAHLFIPVRVIPNSIMYKRSIILPQPNLRDVTMEGKVRG